MFRRISPFSLICVACLVVATAGFCLYTSNLRHDLAERNAKWQWAVEPIFDAAGGNAAYYDRTPEKGT